MDIVVLEMNQYGIIWIERSKLLSMRKVIENDVNDDLGFRKYKALLALDHKFKLKEVKKNE